MGKRCGLSKPLLWCCRQKLPAAQRWSGFTTPFLFFFLFWGDILLRAFHSQTTRVTESISSGLHNSKSIYSLVLDGGHGKNLHENCAQENFSTIIPQWFSTDFNDNYVGLLYFAKKSMHNVRRMIVKERTEVWPLKVRCVYYYRMSFIEHHRISFSTLFTPFCHLGMYAFDCIEQNLYGGTAAKTITLLPNPYIHAVFAE